MLNHPERIGKKTLSERIIDQKVRHGHEMQNALVFVPIRLQSAEIVGVAQLGPQLLENPPIFLRSLRAELTCEMALQICCDSVAIKQRVVYVEQEHDASRRIIALVHYSIMGNAPPLIVQMSRVCHGKMQRHRKCTCSAFSTITTPVELDRLIQRET